MYKKANNSFVNKSTLLILLLVISISVNAQEDNKGTIDAQRPTLTESYSIIIPNMIQFENGLDYFSHSDTFGYGTFIRGSATKRIELRAFTNYKKLNTVGAKFIAMEPEGSALGVGASFVYNRDLQNKSNDFRLAMTKDFNQVFATFNFGYNGELYNIILLGIPLSNQFNYFIEYYNAPQLNRLHTGLTWIPHRDIQLDINGGWLDTDSWYAGCGVSFRLR